jgi:peptidoglycan hydrolase-like protein with peptidoglycan-binding domain
LSRQWTPCEREANISPSTRGNARVTSPRQIPPACNLGDAEAPRPGERRSTDSGDRSWGRLDGRPCRWAAAPFLVPKPPRIAPNRQGSHDQSVPDKTRDLGSIMRCSAPPRLRRGAALHPGGRRFDRHRPLLKSLLISALQESITYRDSGTAVLPVRYVRSAVSSARRFLPWLIIAIVIVVAVVLAVVLLGGSEDDGGSADTVTSTAAGETTTATDPAVEDLQRVMTRLGYYSGPIDGVYGPTTSAGVTEMQKALGVEADGVFGPSTEAALKGKGKDVVIDVQTELAEYGYYTGPIDGHYGPGTQAAVEKLQTDLGVTADGRVGAETVAAFNKAVADGTLEPSTTTSTTTEPTTTGATETTTTTGTTTTTPTN